MKFGEILNEEFLDYVGSFGGDYPVFVNPNGREMLELKLDMSRSGIRFIADNKTKKFYVFDGNILHMRMAKKYDIDYKNTNTNAFFGEGTVSGGKLKVERSFMLDETNKKMLFGNIDIKWGWTNKYSNLTRWMKKRED